MYNFVKDQVIPDFDDISVVGIDYVFEEKELIVVEHDGAVLLNELGEVRAEFVPSDFNLAVKILLPKEEG